MITSIAKIKLGANKTVEDARKTYEGLAAFRNFYRNYWLAVPPGDVLELIAALEAASAYAFSFGDEATVAKLRAVGLKP